MLGACGDSRSCRDLTLATMKLKLWWVCWMWFCGCNGWYGAGCHANAIYGHIPYIVLAGLAWEVTSNPKHFNNALPSWAVICLLREPLVYTLGSSRENLWLFLTTKLPNVHLIHHLIRHCILNSDPFLSYSQRLLVTWWSWQNCGWTLTWSQNCPRWAGKAVSPSSDFCMKLWRERGGGNSPLVYHQYSIFVNQNYKVSLNRSHCSHSAH